MTDKEKTNDEHLQQQTKERNVQQEKEKERLEELRRWFESQGDCT